MAVLWVDDDINSFSRPYYEELIDNNYQIKAFEEPDSALNYFKVNHNNFSCAIIDLMLPTGKTFNVDETSLGIRTGKFLIEKLLEINPKLPIIILSVANDIEVINWAKEKNIIYLNKSATFPHDLLQVVSNYFENN